MQKFIQVNNLDKSTEVHQTRISGGPMEMKLRKTTYNDQLEDKNCKSTRQLSQHHRQWLKLGICAAVIAVLYTIDCHATLEDQLDKATNLVTGKFAKMMLGGAAACGAVGAIVKGNFLLALAICGAAAVTAMLIALIKAGSIFTVMQ